MTTYQGMEMGVVLTTRRIHELIQRDSRFKREVLRSLEYYKQHDWGIVSSEDKAENDHAVVEGDRILAAYDTKRGKIWIMTECDRSATTILFPSEY